MGKNNAARPSKPPLLTKSSPLRLWPFSRRKTRAGLSSSTRAPAAAAINLSQVDRYLFKNFPSLYNGSKSHSEDSDGDYYFNDDDDDICRSFYISKPTDMSPRMTLPPLKAVRATERFFVRPSAASSLVEEARMSDASCSGGGGGGSSGWPSDASRHDREAVVTFSKEPYGDFLQSMREMVEAHRATTQGTLDWNFMEELLLSYLDLNDRSVHGHILQAFTDIAFATRQGRIVSVPLPY